MKVLILANGDAPAASFLRGLAQDHDLIVASDGAAHKALAVGLMPRIVCGDFDSIDLDAARQGLPSAEFVSLPDQNLTDLEKTLALAIARGATSITIAGALGGRIDHALGGIALLLRYHGQIDLRIAGAGCEIRAVSGAAEIATTPGDTISLLAFAPGIRVTIAGVKWPLENQVLDIGTIGISNVALGDTVRLEVRGGAVVFCRLTKIIPSP